MMKVDFLVDECSVGFLNRRLPLLFLMFQCTRNVKISDTKAHLVLDLSSVPKKSNLPK